MDWLVVTSHWTQSGKTTVATLLAAELAKHGHKTALVDLTADRQAQRVLNAEAVTYHALDHDGLTDWATSADAEIAVVDGGSLAHVTQEPLFDAAHFLWLVPDDAEAISELVKASEIILEARAAGRSMTMLGFAFTKAHQNDSLAEPFAQVAGTHLIGDPIPGYVPDLADAYAPLCQQILTSMAWTALPAAEPKTEEPPPETSESDASDVPEDKTAPTEHDAEPNADHVAVEASPAEPAEMPPPSPEPPAEAPSAPPSILPFPAPRHADVSSFLSMGPEPSAPATPEPVPVSSPAATLPAAPEPTDAPLPTPEPADQDPPEPQDDPPAEPETEALPADETSAPEASFDEENEHQTSTPPAPAAKDEEEEAAPITLSKPPGYAYVFDAKELGDETEARTGVPMRSPSQIPRRADDPPSSTTVQLTLDEDETPPNRKVVAWGLIAFGVVLFVVTAAWLAG